MDELTSFGNKLLTKVLKLCYEMKKKKLVRGKAVCNFILYQKTYK